MTQINYVRNHFASVLAIDEERLQQIDVQLGRFSDGEYPESYHPGDISVYREILGTVPEPITTRKQLFLNFKGGTGKTSISVSYAHCLAELGYTVLLVDLDSQGHAAKCLGIDAEQCELTLYEILVKKVPSNEVIIQCPLKELNLIPSNLRMSTVDLALMPMNAREYKMQRVFDTLESHYDFIIMDAPPSFGLLNLNALIASTELFVPVLADFLSFHGLKLLFDTISGLEQDLQLMLDQIYIFINHYNPTTIIARQAKEALEKHYTEYLLTTVVRQCTKFAQSSAEGIPITLFDPTCKAAEDISQLIEEIFQRTSNSQYKEVV